MGVGVDREAAVCAQLLADACWIAERTIEGDGLLYETAHDGRTYGVCCAQLNGGHLVLPARLETRVKVSQTLASPESEQDALILCADEDDRTV